MYVNLGNIRAIPHRIGLIRSDMPYNAAHYRTGPKALEQEEFKSKRQLAAGGIDDKNIPVFEMPTKKGLDISSSAITSDCSPYEQN